MFLYLFTISIQLYSVEMIINGKIPISGWSSNKRKTYEESDNESGLWSLPEEGWITVEVDGSFVSQSGQAGIGVVARGNMYFSAWRVLFDCANAAEEEA
jgi:hypothetical protein